MRINSQLTKFIFLPKLRLVKIENRGRNGAYYHCQKTSNYEVCPKCASIAASVYDHRQVKIKDAPIRGKFVVLIVRKRRFWCRGCRKPFMEPISGVSKG